MATVSSGKSYRFQSMEADEYLNILTDGNLANNTNVTTYGLNESDMAQVWQCESHSYGSVSGMLMRSKKNTAFVLDRYRGSSNYNNADIYTAATTESDLKDQLVEFVPRAYGYYRIKLVYYDLYLTRSSTATYGGKNVVWRAQTGNMDQLWLAHEYGSSSSGSADPVPSAIKDKTFFIRNAMTGNYLNVYGTDTVANERNVNVYAKENCLAQKWVARQTKYGGKLFTKINESYALNLNRNTNNCSMYQAENNDDDSLLEFELFTDNVTTAADKMYRIKMFRHGKYLAAESSSNGANVYWADSMYGNTIWQFLDEDQVFHPANPIPSEIKNQEFYLRAGDSSCYLNVHGVDTVAIGRNVNVYSKDKCKAQCWIPSDYHDEPRLFTKINSAFGLNIYSDTNPNCTMYTVESNDNDSVLQFEYVDEKQYRIKMHYHNKYLAVDGNIVSGANVIWVDNANSATIWTFEREDEVFVPAPAAPASIVNKTCFIHAEGTVYYLNVHGSDTVANTRNVDVFTVENCQAQRWIARGAAKDPKLHTAIDETYALNIYKDDCTMYTAAGNDMDSILEFIPVSIMKYKIKMFHHNKYLAISGTPSIGADVVWVDNAADANVWEFIPEEDIDLPEGGIPVEFPADSSLVTTVIPAHTNNFTPNRSTNGSQVSEICIHHTAGNITVENLGAMWQNPNRAGSSHYGVNGTQVGQYVKESDIAWTNGHWESNKRSITIETANSSGGPEWFVSDETLDTLIALVADIATRNNLGKLVVGENLTYHSMYSATLCPGPYLKSKLNTIAAEVNKINSHDETVPLDLLNKTFYIQNYINNNYINIDSSGGATRSALNILNLDIAGDKNSQRWTIVPAVNGVKMVSAFKGKTTLIANDDNSCGFVSNSEDTDDLDMEIIPYTDNNVGYYDNLFYIKLKNQNLFLTAVGSSLSWVYAISNACLWKFKTKDEVLPEIFESKKNELGELIIANYQLRRVMPNITGEELWIRGSMNGPTIITPKAVIASRYELHDTHTIVGEGLEGITIDYESDGNGTYTIDADVFGLEAALYNIEISGKDNAYELAANVGAKFPGGEFYFTFKPTSQISAEFGIIYNFSLFPDDKTIDSKVSFKATYTVTLLPDPPEYEFNLDPNLVPNATAIAIWFVIALGVCAGVVSVSGVGLIAVLCGLSATNFIYPVLGTEFDVEE